MKKKTGRPLGSKRPGSRPDLKKTTKPAKEGSAASKPIEVAVEREGTVRETVTKMTKEIFLKAFAIQGTKLHAAQSAHISRRTVDNWLKEDPEFREAFKIASEDSTDMIEHAVRVRAMAGVKRTVYYKGKPIGSETEFSDTCAIFLLKAYRPEKFRERYELTGAGGGPIEVSNPIQRIMAKLAEIKARSTGLLSDGGTASAGGEVPGGHPGASSGEGAA
jgi:hypothetical protein